MNQSANDVSKSWPWRLIVVALAVLILCLILYGVMSRHRQSISAVPIDVMPATIDEKPNDPVDFESVPSYQEAKFYAKAAGQRDLSKSELDRVVALSSSQHPLTALKAFGILLSVDVGNSQSQIVRHAINILKNPDTNLRSSVMVVIGRYGVQKDGAALMPFLQSPVASDVRAAKNALKKLGFDVPAGNRPKD